MERTSRRALAAALAGLATAALVAVAAAGGAPDRLDRFRQLADARLSPAEILEPDSPADAFREVWALLDEEIVENLGAGGVFASTGFLQERLDAFADAWGGARLRVVRLGPLVVGAFELGETAGAQSVRAWGRLDAEPALLTALVRDGRPTLLALPTPSPRAVVLWEGRPTGRGTRPLRVDLLRPEVDGLRVAWSTATVFPEGLLARSWSLRGGELRLRYEARYPGWTPGCDEQTEEEDVYRLAPHAAHFVRVSRRQHNAWHRELHAAAARLYEALAARDQARLARLVPDARVRTRLPAGLGPEPACDAPQDPARATVSVAATADDRRPWSLTFRRGRQGWHLTAAAPVLQ